jgi:hypothetical protein
MRAFLGGLGQRLAVGAAALSLVTGAIAWGSTQSAGNVALASSCNNHSEGRCDSKAARAEDAKEVKNEQQCRAEHTEESCRDRARSEDQEEQATECDQENDRDQNSDCETYGAYGEPGDHLHIAELDAATKALGRAGVDTSLIGTATSILVVAGTFLAVAIARRRAGRLTRKVS